MFWRELWAAESGESLVPLSAPPARSVQNPSSSVDSALACIQTHKSWYYSLND